ncbi:addiction module protein [Candidatus Sumerlaeota bacterium]|nr:addiction module protein [Candidatus Sumerlaeota bacterium]
MGKLELDELTKEAMSLPPGNRAKLAELLIQSLDQTDDPEIRSAWVSEIRRRDEQIRSGQKVTKSAEQVLKEAREQLRCIG